ncbi:hypothetical protein CPB83DRAFT_854184 [Crepidotus variabilis]|uniref:DASH complex subunit DUO1 n=1 Tax=Crepidotus variabilis TaxID=179855 RepID=A0A9P6EG49_9AGAR|nr:hypothetical protein CPB83DRAFT_854184 [Crepidotus variabilis]
MDSPDINASHSGSRLLSTESPNFQSDSSNSRTGPGGDDLSLSELSLGPDSVMSKPFSLLARVNPPQPPTPTPPVFSPPPTIQDLVTPTRPQRQRKSEGKVFGPQNEQDAEESEEDEGEEQTVVLDEEVPVPEDPEVARKRTQELREEKLKSDMFVLKKLNASFELYRDALAETGSANERVAAQIAETDGLLNKYINILNKSEDYAKLIFDERWNGAEADEEEALREYQESIVRAKREAEEKARREREEQERLEREQEEQRKREERERIEKEKSAKAIRGTVRGVRGTRASTRGATSSRASATAGPSRGVPKRPPSATGRPAGSGIPRVSSVYRPT